MNIKHKKCSHFLNINFFSHITKFEDLEDRIMNLPQEERGDAFEVFAQAYFATQRIAQVKKVWTFDEVPQHVRAVLGLGQRDMGIDGVILTNQEIYQAYQVKYRSGRESLTWQEISTFMGLSDHVTTRILFTNSNELPSVLDDRTGFYAITGADLDRLNEQDFYAIEQWLKDSPVVVSKASPRPHQREALEAIGGSLKDHDRVTAVMACGTGKTLLALWLAEQQDAQSVLVLLPSLSLVRQTLHEWIKETKWRDFSFLCICSDKSVVTNDEIVVKQIDCDFPVTTDVVEIQKFLEHSKHRKIVFSTYQSSMLIPQNFVFDIAIFDEAHKTAGREGTKFAYALKDENIAIKKRVFLTATPRHYDITKKNKEGEAHLVFSMDDQNVYGPIGYRLSFAEAAKRDIICNYKIIISVVTSDSLDRDLLKHGEVVVQGDPVKAHRIVNILALTNAIESYNIKRIFTFHNSVKTAQSFTSNTSEGVGAFIKDFNLLHVNGEMPTSTRERIMHDFKNSSNAIMSNARCLTEGVDVPAVDMVAFISPKKSKVDIVQATGRAMRKAEGKDCGYILVPIFLEASQGESIEEALKKTQYDDIWQVLQALQEHDESLTEVIGQMRQEIGRTGSCNDSRLREKIEVLAPEVELVKLREAITTYIAEKLGLPWDERFGELLKFKEEHGHCNVPDDLPLGAWLGAQRRKYKDKILLDEYITKLDEIGFDWDPLDTAWKNKYADLCQYQKEHGHCNVPQGYLKNKPLGVWVHEQRQNYKHNKLKPEYVEKLNAIGFNWDPSDIKWEKMFQYLCQYQKENGHCNVPKNYPPNKSLGGWVSRQRQNYKKGKLSKEYKDRLEEIGFDWDPVSSFWERMFADLCKYTQENGHCYVPQNYPQNRSLATWVATQRQNYKKGKLSKEYINRLEEIGFDWDPVSSVWEKMFADLCKYKQEHGHCNVPYDYPLNPLLSTWVRHRREEFKRGDLALGNKYRLEEIGFDWDPSDIEWKKMFQYLCQYQKENGHCNVPQNYPPNKSLGGWVSRQRQNYKKGKLSKEYKDRLEEIGFDWDPVSSVWERMFADLCKYTQENGHCNVPQNYPQNRSLATWVATQRQNYKKGKLSQEYINRLNAIGFDLDPLSNWEKTYLALCDYKQQNGHCNVPATYHINEFLGMWVATQRQNYKKGKLSQEYINKLNAIGFDWDPVSSAWEKNFHALRQYAEENGHCNVPDNYLINPSLGRWVGAQRRKYKVGKLSQERINRLNAIDFKWSIVSMTRKI